MSGSPRGGSPWGTEPTVTTPWAARSSTLEATMAPMRTTRPHGTRGARRAPPKRMTSETMPTTAVVGSISGIDVTIDQARSCTAPIVVGHPQQAGDLPDDDEDDQAEDEAGDDRPGHELRGPAQPREAPDEEADAGADGQSGCQGHRSGGIALRHVGDQRAGEHRHRGDGADDEVGRRAEQCVGDQRERDGVQADDDGHARDAGVAEGLRHRQRGDDEPGQDVARDEPPPVPGEPPRDRQVVVQR